MLKGATRPYLTNLSKVIVITLGTIIWSLTMVRSGWYYKYGFGFWGANGHDGVWHLALSRSLAHMSLENPVYSGFFIKNYHLGFDIILALINQVTRIPVSYLYFQILPPIIALFIGLLVYNFVYRWRKSKSEAFWSTFFVYFSGGFGFIVTFLRNGVFTGESMFWSQQSVSTLINPPFALSLIFILLGFIALQKKNLFLSILFFGLLIQIKAYAAILILGGLFVTAVYSYYINHSTYYLKVFFGSLALNLILFFLVKNDGLSSFVWQPFWYLETLMSYSDRLGWEKFYSAMTTYKMGHIWVKGVAAYLTAFVIFVIGNMGLRIIGFTFLTRLVKKEIKLDEITVLIISVLFGAVLIPMFFVQNGTPWNTIQFFYYYLFLFSILAGISTSWLIDKFKYLSKFILVGLISIFALLSAWSTLQHYLPKMPQAIVSSTEFEALRLLSLQPDGVVLTYPFDTYKAQSAINNPPRPLYVYDSTSYVSAFTDKKVFLDDEVNLNIMGYDWKTRRDAVLWFVSNLDIKKGKDFLTANNIKYLYLVKAISPLSGELLKLGSTELGLNVIFENKDYIIYRYGEDFGSN